MHFTGIQRDYDFLYDALTENQSKFNIKISLLKENVVQAVDRLSNLKELFERMQNDSPFEELKAPSVKNLFEKATDSKFEMAVVATMSSGKSTLINALVGDEILPARNEATTAKIAKIFDEDGAPTFIGKCFDDKGNELDNANPLTLEAMNRFNDNENTKEIDIYGDIIGIDSKNIRLVLIDTPGTNNSRTSDHSATTMGLLQEDYKPMIIYVLNSTQLETNDDSYLLTQVAKIIKSGDRQSRDRFLFVLNKADEFDPDKGETVTRKIDDVRKYLSEKHDIENPRIFPASAKIAKVIRQYQKNPDKLTSKDRKYLRQDAEWFIEEPTMHFSDYSEFLTTSTNKELKNKIDEARSTDNEMELALIYTGIPSIELAISEYLNKYAIPAKISEAVYSFKDKIDDLQIEAKEKSKLNNNENEVERKLQDLDRIENFLMKGEKIDSLKKDISLLSSEKETAEFISKRSSEFMLEFGNLINDMKEESITRDKALYFVEKLKNVIPSVCNSLVCDIEKTLNKSIVDQAKKYIEKYKSYIEEMLGELDINVKPASIFGTKASITIDEAMEDYKQIVTVEIGRRSNVKWWNPFSWFSSDTIETEDQERINFTSYIEEKIVPQIESFSHENSSKAKEWAKEQETGFKNFFYKKIDEIDSNMKSKLAEKKEVLKNKEKLQEEIERNKDNLKWITELKHNLDELLKI
ncbi:dynamin family protein [Succinivibrio dextrinosolvens]|uniref:dynamin family protein n=1 Tax=Succinivibrio dextrinosolvens TaxID=83771 RepID=UPI00241FB470|nr:dynamin family protein [Succinivibrio dextrinosolvens]MBE6424207.1 hypothetical protein [Succinivibrio dextrinosolvens]